MHALISPHSASALLFQPDGIGLWDREQAITPTTAAAATAWLASHEDLHWHSAASTEELAQTITGRAEVLKAKGLLSEAKAAYARIMQQHPTERVSRNGYASVLMLLGDYAGALALARARQKDWNSVQEQLAQIANPSLQRICNMLSIQACAEQQDHDGVARAMADLSAGKPSAMVSELIEELRLRCVEKQPGRHSDAWLHERETDCLALAI